MSKVDLIVPKNANSFPNIQTELRHVKEAIEENQGADKDLKETVAKHTTELAEHEDELFEEIPSYVDLGLPSGKLWATMNIGAKSPEDPGLYFSWGNVDGHRNNEEYEFTEEIYDQSQGAELGEENIPVGSKYDTARHFLGGEWTMPTKEDFVELHENCEWEWITINGMNGYKISNNGNFIFLPAAGYFEEGLLNFGLGGDYWSSSCDGEYDTYYLVFRSDKVGACDTDSRYYGYSIRPIHPGTSTPAPIKRSKKANISDVENIKQGLQQDITNIQQDIDFLKNNVNFQDGLVTSYIINQSGDVQNRLTEDMIENHVASMLATEKTYINGNYEFIDVIARIRAHSHLYIGKYNENSDILEIKQVSDADKTKYADGSDIEWTYVEDEITKYYDIDLFMKLPEFWWKCEEVATDVYKVSFSMDSDFVDDTWHHWEGDTFIGVYEAIIDNGKCYSRKDVTPTVNQSWNQFTTAATAKTDNENVPYRIVNYEAHQIMCLLGYGWLANTDAQAIVGRGSTNYPKTTGLCDSKGMVDTVADVDGGSSAGTSTNVSINFWGLENWWGDIAEWIDNIRTANSSGLINIYDYKNHTVIRTIQNGVVGGNEITKLFLGTNGDVTPTNTISNSNYNRAFAAYGDVNGGAGDVASRSAYAAHLSGGLAYLVVVYSAGVASAIVGSRLLYKGSYTKVNSFTV